MIKYYKTPCRKCGTEMILATFQGKFSLENQNLTVERQDINGKDLVLFFIEKIKKKEKLYVREKTKFDEKILILEFDEETKMFIEKNDARIRFSEKTLIEIATGEFNFTEKSIILVDLIGDIK